jgi:pilus assembly protein CpaE
MNIDRLDMRLLKGSLCHHETGLSILPHPVQMSDIGLIQEDHLQRVIGLLRASYTHLLLDLSKRFTATDLTGLRLADVILLVAQLELSSLRNVVRMLAALGMEEGLMDKVRVVINRSGCDFFDGAISLKKAEETLGKPIYWQVPNDPKSMMSAHNAGVPLIQHAPRSKVQQNLAELAQALSGKNGHSEAEPRKSSRIFPFRK